jgi:hypothetical protein
MITEERGLYLELFFRAGKSFRVVGSAMPPDRGTNTEMGDMHRCHLHGAGIRHREIPYFTRLRATARVPGGHQRPVLTSGHRVRRGRGQPRRRSSASRSACLPRLSALVSHPPCRLARGPGAARSSTPALRATSSRLTMLPQRTPTARRPGTFPVSRTADAIARASEDASRSKSATAPNGPVSTPASSHPASDRASSSPSVTSRLSHSANSQLVTVPPPHPRRGLIGPGTRGASRSSHRHVVSLAAQ